MGNSGPEGILLSLGSFKLVRDQTAHKWLIQDLKCLVRKSKTFKILKEKGQPIIKLDDRKGCTKMVSVEMWGVEGSKDFNR